MKPVLYGLFSQGCRWVVQIHLVTKVLVQLGVLKLPLWFVDVIASEMVTSYSEVRLLVYFASGISMA